MKKVIIIAAMLASTNALSQVPNASKGESVDPNQTVCTTLSETGSRLARSRVCMTRAQWDQRRRETRQSVERVQTQRVEREF
jgi:hypothetical protein